MLSRLRAIPGLEISENVALAGLTRFGIGGPARILLDARTETALLAAIALLREWKMPYAVIGGGSNLIANDEGFSGAVVRFTDSSIGTPERGVNHTRVRAAAGAVLQDLVDRTISLGLRGIETLTGIPGWVGGAVYGNAGAYGHSLHERVQTVRILDTVGAEVRVLDNAGCAFRYRESVFKKNKEWILLSADLDLDLGDPETLRDTAAGIRKIRDEKYPPTMRCAGSIFKNLIYAELPASARAHVPEKVIREGKVPSAYFLEQAGAKGTIFGGVRVADYHANLIYSDGNGTARELRALIGTLKRRVQERFGVELEEEVQYI